METEIVEFQAVHLSYVVGVRGYSGLVIDSPDEKRGQGRRGKADSWWVGKNRITDQVHTPAVASS